MRPARRTAAALAPAAELLESRLLLAAPDISFDAARAYVTDNGPYRLATADLNDDGKADVVTANRDGGTFTVLLNNGDGTFAPRVEYPAGTSPSSLAVADLDGDGDADVIVVAGSAERTVGVYANNGDGTFAVRVSYAAAPTAGFVTAADLTGDARPELVVTGSSSTGVLSVYPNAGDGTFGPRADYSTGGNLFGAAAADFDGDGWADLALAGGETHKVVVVRNRQDGTFGAATTVATSEGSSAHVMSVVATDLTGDGRPDVAAADGAGGITVVRNVGGGAFAPAVRYAWGNEQTGRLGSLSAGDLDGDGRPELVAQHGLSGAVGVLRNTGGGAFAPVVAFLGVGGGGGSALADVDADGATDIVVSGGQSKSVAVLRNRGDATFATRADYPVNRAIPLAAADVDGDGRTDLLVTGASTGATQGSIGVYRNVGGGAFGPRVDYPTTGSADDLVVADLTGDGRPDLATVRYQAPSTLGVLRNNGDGTFAASVDYPAGALVTSVTAADLDGDGDLDLATVTHDAQVRVFLNDGAGTFTPGAEVTLTGTPGSIAAGDLDGDGLAELLVADSQGLKVLRNLGNASFAFRVIYDTGSGGQTVLTADVDGDAKLDVIVTAYRAVTGPVSGGYVAVFRGNGDGTLGARAEFNALGSGPPGGLAVADFDADGLPDLAISRTTSAAVTILRNAGGGAFVPGPQYATGRLPASVVAADFNGDGKPDLAVDSDFGVGVLLNTTGPDVTPPTTLSGRFDGGGRRQELKVSFSERVTVADAPAALRVTNLTTGQVIDPSAIAFAYDGQANAGTWTFFPQGGAVLPDGKYEAVLSAASVTDGGGHALQGSATYTFVVFAGDTNGDQTVNFSDLVKLAQNYNATGGQRTWAQGDFTGDGNVNFADLVKLAQNYNKSAGQAAGPVAADFAKAVAAARASVGTTNAKAPTKVLKGTATSAPRATSSRPTPVARPSVGATMRPATSNPPARPFLTIKVKPRRLLDELA